MDRNGPKLKEKQVQTEMERNLLHVTNANSQSHTPFPANTLNMHSRLVGKDTKKIEEEKNWLQVSPYK